MTTPDLATLLAPLSVAQFFQQYFEQQPLHLPRSGTNLYDSLISTTHLEQLIGDPNSRFPAVQLARGGHYLPPETYTHDLRFGGVVFQGVADVQRIASEYRNGASVVLPALHRLWAPIGELCGRIERQLDHALHANAYLTAGNAPGFTPHYDTHEVLVLQIAGSKLWSLYPSPIQLPYRSEPFDPARYQPAEPSRQIRLSAGDLLYLPRGTMHSAATEERYSAHVTLGISVYTWADLVRGLTVATTDDVQLRRALPAGFATHPQVQLQLEQRLRSLVPSPGPGIDLDQVIQKFIERVRARTLSPKETFRADVISIDENSPLRAPASLRYRIVEEADNVVLEFEGRRHRLPRQVAAALRALVDHPGVRTSELPGDLPLDARLGLSRYLLELGFLSLDR